MSFPRSSGILCHPTSFPGSYGIGDLGRGAYEFLDWLASAKQQLWQVLPLGPTGYGDSPYQSFSAFAGNPLLISPDGLVESGLLPSETVSDVPGFSAHRVDFGSVIRHKQGLLRRSYEHFLAHASASQRTRFLAFRDANSSWLAEYSLFMALKAEFGGGSWLGWPRDILMREPATLAHYRSTLADSMTYQEYLQWLFSVQWKALKGYAHGRGIQIIGDIPIFVSEDSADVWSHPELFKLDADRKPTVIAGVPPDFFSETGQRWGNPHYRWDVMAQDGYRWWIERIRHTLTQVDIVRIDHFRGFEAAWEVPAGDDTAANGKWVEGPGASFFQAVETALGKLSIIAEDLGVITAEVDALRLQFELPGMKILQFAFGIENNPKYLPHNFEQNCIVYPGTHDNNTVIGWFNETGRVAGEKWNCLRYIGASNHENLPWDFIRLAWGSVANQAVACLQDVMRLGAEARMNYPSTKGGNWQWRYTPEMLTDALRARLAEITEIYERDRRPKAESEKLGAEDQKPKQASDDVDAEDQKQEDAPS
jgi:4-alpha-glucanotransferase